MHVPAVFSTAFTGQSDMGVFVCRVVKKGSCMCLLHVLLFCLVAPFEDLARRLLCSYDEILERKLTTGAARQSDDSR